MHTRAAELRGRTGSRPVGHSRHLHVVSKIDNPLDQSTPQDGGKTPVRLTCHENLGDSVQSRTLHECLRHVGAFEDTGFDLQSTRKVEVTRSHVINSHSIQTTVFSMCLKRKKLYFEFDYVLQMPKPDLGQFSVITPRVVYGVSPQAEVGANIGINHVNDGGGNDTYFQPDAKYKFWADDDNGLAASAGVVLPRVA